MLYALCLQAPVRRSHHPRRDLGSSYVFPFGIIGIAILYYALNKTLTVGFTDSGGRLHEIPFTRSVVEGQVIDEAEASRVCDIIQRLVNAGRERMLESRLLPRILMRDCFGVLVFYLTGGWPQFEAW